MRVLRIHMARITLLAGPSDRASGGDVSWRVWLCVCVCVLAVGRCSPPPSWMVGEGREGGRNRAALRAAAGRRHVRKFLIAAAAADCI